MSWQFWSDPQQATLLKDSAPMALPFMMSATSGTKLSIPRIIEAIIIAAVTGGLTMWVAVSVINAELVYVKGSVNELKAELKELRRDVYTYTLAQQMELLKKKSRSQDQWLNGEDNN